MPVIAAEDLSTEIIQNQFRTPLQNAADGTDPLTDPLAGDRDPNDNTIPPFVLPSFPDQDPLYPHIIVSEAGYNSEHPDARADFTEGEYDVQLKVLARSTTQLNKINDGVRKWVVDRFDTLNDNGFNNPRIVGGGDVPSRDSDPKVQAKATVVRGEVYTQ